MNKTIVVFVLCALPALGCRGRELKPSSGFIAFHLSAGAPGAAVVALGKDTIFLHRVRMVLAELAIAPVLAGECEEEEGEDHPPCVEFDAHPVLIELPLDRPVLHRSTKLAPATSYNLFQAVLHRPTPAADTALLRANPEFAGVSTRVEGVYSRAGKRKPFSFVSDFSEQEEISLQPALVVPAAESLRVTLRVDVGSWFRSSDGATLFDPTSAGSGGPNEHLVRDHIRMSIRVFRDQDGDGQDDDAGS
jgi:hypothetical protein